MQSAKRYQLYRYGRRMKSKLLLISFLFFMSCKTNTGSIEGVWEADGVENTHLIIKITSDTIFQYCNGEFIRGIEYSQDRNKLLLKKDSTYYTKESIDSISFKVDDSCLSFSRKKFYRRDSSFLINADFKKITGIDITLLVYGTYSNEESALKGIANQNAKIKRYTPNISTHKRKYLAPTSDTNAIRKTIENSNFFEPHLRVIFGPHILCLGKFSFINIVDSNQEFQLNSSEFSLRKKRARHDLFLKFSNNSIDTIEMRFDIDSSIHNQFKESRLSNELLIVNKDNSVVTNYHSYEEKSQTLTLVFPWIRILENLDSLDSLNLTELK